jgi:hypothetical protein
MGLDPPGDSGRRQLYEKLWRRRTAGVYRSAAADPARVDVYAFRPTVKAWAPMYAHFVYLTGGMSDLEMPAGSADAGFARIELSAYARRAPGFGDPREDVIATWLHTFAQMPFQRGLRLNPGDVFDAGRPLQPDSEMSAFYFGFAPFIDKAGLLKATLRAEAVAHVTPISEAERRLAETAGAIALVEAFGRAAVPPLFDLERKSCV